MSRYIDADALIMALRLEYPMMPMFKENQKEWEIKTDGYRKAEEAIKNAPSIDIEPKRGEWIYTMNPLRLNDEWECSKCGYLSFTKANYCGHCGCRMKGADDD